MSNVMSRSSSRFEAHGKKEMKERRKDERPQEREPDPLPCIQQSRGRLETCVDLNCRCWPWERQFEGSEQVKSNEIKSISTGAMATE